MKNCIPRYIKEKQQGGLLKKIKQSLALLASCTLCPRQCKKDRIRDEKGYCSTGKKAVVSSFSPQILKALDIAVDNGLNIPLVYNCSGYESIDTLRILKNIMSQYHPMGDARRIKEISNPLTPEEFRKALHMAKKLNLKIIR